MSSHRTWDENQSPQWRYIQEKESIGRKNKRKTSSRIRRQELEQSVIELSLESKNRKKEIEAKLNSELKKHDSKRITRLSTEASEKQE
jgi:hypothetical protein